MAPTTHSVPLAFALRISFSNFVPEIEIGQVQWTVEQGPCQPLPEHCRGRTQRG